ncbi:MAG: outer membrane beta-barrel protein [Flavobacteriales bacterium]
MKGLFTYVLLIGFGCTVQGQDYSINHPKRLKKVVAGLVITPEYLTCVDEAPANNIYEFKYTSKFTQGIGLDVWYGFSEKFFLRTGLYQSFRKYTRKEVCFDCALEFNYESDFRLMYLDVPIAASYKIVNSRVDFIAEGGFVVSILERALENRNSISGSFYDYNVKGTYNTVMAGFQAGLGTNYNLTYRLSLGLNVGYKIYFNRVTDATPMKWRGLSTIAGLYYKF